jgi:predicted nucleic acid-binding protein
MIRRTLFVDTGAWFALADKSDQFHEQAIKIYPDLFRGYQYLTTTNLVVAETYNLIRRALGYQPAIIFLENLSASPRITKIYSEAILEDKAEKILRKYDAQDFSFTDVVSFAVMEEYGINKAFSFDRHFLIVGFTIIPQIE